MLLDCYTGDSLLKVLDLGPAVCFAGQLGLLDGVAFTDLAGCFAELLCWRFCAGAALAGPAVCFAGQMCCRFCAGAKGGFTGLFAGLLCWRISVGAERGSAGCFPGLLCWRFYAGAAFADLETVLDCCAGDSLLEL